MPRIKYLVKKHKKLFKFPLLILNRHRNIIVWKIFRKKIDRNQWIATKRRNTYNKMMSYSWEETKSNLYPYYLRLNFVVERAKGEVLEIGCGIGNLTKWICKSEKVKRVVAIDAFREPLEVLKSYKIPKVIPIQMRLENIKFKNIKKFDTVVICEVIEHIYPDEEKKMLNALRNYVDSETIFIVSTPIGWMVDQFHVRGFTKKQFKNHLKKHYGEPLEIDYSSGYSQIAYGYFNLNKN
ncbi:MAG: methyltransferase domain-containing protein [Candidatus Helarchaeota archaeon]|nr:methyltransferase domain-containing protein [Candidatus Helarchaeota archaeon]